MLPQSLFGNGPDRVPPNRTSLDQGCGRILITDDNRRVRRVERMLEPGWSIFPVVLAPQGATDNPSALPPHLQIGVHQDHIRCRVRRSPITDILTIGEMGAFENLTIMPAA